MLDSPVELLEEVSKIVVSNKKNLISISSTVEGNKCVLKYLWTKASFTIVRKLTS